MNLLSPQWMLLIGVLLSPLMVKRSLKTKAKSFSSKLLQLSVVLLGVSLNFNAVLKQSYQGALLTAGSIAMVFLLGFFAQKLLPIDKTQGLLITMGTAICGGSAIGALAPVVRADSVAIGISIGVVFLLNAVAVFIFPFFGDLLNLTQDQFGLWAALAIHDTSSVVAASSIFGQRALEVATTIKLTRALWIIPIILYFSSRVKNHNRKVTFPWFILGFIAMSLIFTFLDTPPALKSSVTALARAGFSLTLLFIGLSFDFSQIKEAGTKPLIYGTLLWVIISIASVVCIIL